MKTSMIAAAFVPGCPSAWQRGVFELVRSEVLRDVPGIDRWPPFLWLALPAVCLTLVALWAVQASRHRVLLITVGASVCLNVWMPLVLLPLLWAVRPWPPPGRWRMAAAVAVLAGAAAYAATPSCSIPVADIESRVAVAGAMRMLASALGLAGGCLVLLRLVFGSPGRMDATFVGVAAIGCVVAAMVPGADVATTLAPGITALWWLGFSGGLHVIRWQTGWLARAGAAMLVVLAPVLAIASAVRAQPASGDDPPATMAAWDTLSRVRAPTVLVADESRLDVLASLWRAGGTTAQRSLQLVPPADDAVVRALGTHAVYAWRRPAHRLAERGFLVAPVAEPDARSALVWRVLGHRPCASLTAEWTDVTSEAREGQVSGLFPVVAPLRGALMYVASPIGLGPRPIDWSPDTAPAFEARVFDLTVGAERSLLSEAAGRDGFDTSRLAGARFVARVRFDRRSTAPDTLPVALGGDITSAWARLYSPGEGGDNAVMLCRRGVGRVVAGYDEAPAVVRFNLFDPQVVGAGWHQAEQVGDARFRWTAAAEAELYVELYRPEPLVFRIEAEAPSNVRVTLNGVPATCQSGAPPCDWTLPERAMRHGTNVVTIHSVTVPAPPPDPRMLGVMVRSAELARPGS